MSSRLWQMRDTNAKVLMTWNLTLTNVVQSHGCCSSFVSVTCIALRTLVLQGNTAYIQAGTGIVADSVPESEFHETINKAKGLLKASDS